MSREKLIKRARLIERLRKEPMEGSATAMDPLSLLKILTVLDSYAFNRMLDLGCGYGNLTRSIAEYLDISEVYGVDLDEQRLSIAKSRGISTLMLDLNKERLPFPDCYFDLVTSFGVIEHLIYWDNLISESFRVLRDGGIFILAMPNLGNYINRLALLLGHQPRDIEISSARHFGVLPFYVGGWFGHIHSATLRTMKGMLAYYGFRLLKVQASATPSPPTMKAVVKLADKLFSMIPSLSRRFIILSEKP